MVRWSAAAGALERTRRAVVLGRMAPAFAMLCLRSGATRDPAAGANFCRSEIIDVTRVHGHSPGQNRSRTLAGGPRAGIMDETRRAEEALPYPPPARAWYLVGALMVFYIFSFI